MFMTFSSRAVDQVVIKLKQCGSNLVNNNRTARWTR